MPRKRILIILAMLFVIGLVLFFQFGVKTTKSGPSYTQNCTDVANRYEPCELHDVKYGLPFTYAQGHPFIPGDSYSWDNVEAIPLLANLVVWVLPLPIIYFIISAKRK